jgi:hypothetical protein
MPDTKTVTQKVQHTPGPWKVNDVLPRLSYIKEFRGRNWREVDAGEHYSAVVVFSAPLSGDTAVPEVEANARLIAAAPDLLAAVRAIAEEVPPMWGDDVRDGYVSLRLPEGHIDTLFMALARAEGRTL